MGLDILDEGRVRHLGRHLMLKGEHAEKILSGAKTTTIRLGLLKPRYEEIIIHSGGRPIAKARIMAVRHKRISNLTSGDAVRDGFNSVDELLDYLRKAYGELKPETTVTIIEFQLVKRFDEAHREDPYLGLEPGDIARLALRYLKGELDEEEERILKSLTETNSIRLTARRLRGSPSYRSKVRATLRKAVKMLYSRRIIGYSP